MGKIFSSVLEPVALIHENICVFSEAGREYFEVVCIEAIPNIIKDFGPLAPGAETGYVELSDIYLNKPNQIAQIWISPIDKPVSISIKQPGSCQKWAMTKTPAVIDGFIDEYNGCCCGSFNLTQFFQHYNQSLMINVKNENTLSLPKSRLLLRGFVYILKKLMSRPAQYTVVPVASCGAIGCGGD